MTDFYNIPSVNLTTSQESLIQQSLKIIPHFKILVIKGESSSGKFTTVKELFIRLNAVVESLDLCTWASKLPNEISSQDIIHYLDSLLFNLNKRLNTPNNSSNSDNEGMESRKRPRTTVDNAVGNAFGNAFGNLSLTNNSQKNCFGIIYIRHYNRITDVLNDSNAKLRFLLPLIMKTFAEKLPEQIKIVITTQGCILPEGLHWTLELETTSADMRQVIEPYLQNGKLSNNLVFELLKISRIVPVGRILYCLKYGLAIGDSETSILEAYRKALSKYCGPIVDVDKNVPIPNLEKDLVGLESLLDEIHTAIINPMQLGLPNISIKKGLLLCGPPGTGKTSIGRWLSHQIKGKFYLIGNEVGKDFVNHFEALVRKAKDNAPAVIFIDDCDFLFEHDEIYRSFLTILDGLETNRRNDVCVILTCMHLKKIPAPLIRGGRLEMVLFTKLPTYENILNILKQGVRSLVLTLTEYNHELGTRVRDLITPDFIKNLALKMSGWNCADIHRCLNDVIRLLVAGKGYVNSSRDLDIGSLFDKCLKQITKQYKLCGKCESTDLTETLQDSYIM